MSREDEAIIALASFGTNSAGTILRMHKLITYDQPMMTGYTNHLPTLQHRLWPMTAQVPVPFHYAVLPELTTPETVRFE